MVYKCTFERASSHRYGDTLHKHANTHNSLKKKDLGGFEIRLLICGME